ncbi:hypothetical protein FJU08_09220 [Martelella alba]|uniref:Uncharacterized protein n=1 Tax=Martelella alba TaxID=2590451 RepID=A0A506UBS4_9HYPH|nr:hypothetical protein [Martelella alba]TPW30846.1 hypothetical protein FJU08_09220 [Martelella alba]
MLKLVKISTLREELISRRLQAFQMAEGDELRKLVALILDNLKSSSKLKASLNKYYTNFSKKIEKSKTEQTKLKGLLVEKEFDKFKHCMNFSYHLAKQNAISSEMMRAVACALWASTIAMLSQIAFASFQSTGCEGAGGDAASNHYNETATGQMTGCSAADQIQSAYLPPGTPAGAALGSDFAINFAPGVLGSALGAFNERRLQQQSMSGQELSHMLNVAIVLGIHSATAALGATIDFVTNVAHQVPWLESLARAVSIHFSGTVIESGIDLLRDRAMPNASEHARYFSKQAAQLVVGGVTQQAIRAAWDGGGYVADILGYGLLVNLGKKVAEMAIYRARDKKAPPEEEQAKCNLTARNELRKLDALLAGPGLLDEVTLKNRMIRRNRVEDSAELARDLIRTLQSEVEALDRLSTDSAQIGQVAHEMRNELLELWQHTIHEAVDEDASVAARIDAEGQSAGLMTLASTSGSTSSPASMTTLSEENETDLNARF